MKKQLILALGLFIAPCGVIKAQETYNSSNTSMTFLSVPVNARSGGMAEMGVATSPDGYAHYTNAAKQVFLDESWKGGASLSYVPWLRNLIGDMEISGVSGFYQLNDVSTISASFRYFAMGEVEYTNMEQQVVGSHRPHELAADFAYARKLSENFSMALALRYGLSNIAKGSNAYNEYQIANTFSFDVNAYYQQNLNQSNLLSAGAAITNVGSKVKYSNDREYFLPTEFKLGVNNRTMLDEENSLAYGLELANFLVPSSNDLGENVFSNMAASFSGGKFFKEMQYKIGTEYAYNNFLFARMGYSFAKRAYGSQQFLTFGAGTTYKILSFDLSYLVSTSNISKNPVANTLRLSLGVKF